MSVICDLEWLHIRSEGIALTDDVRLWIDVT